MMIDCPGHGGDHAVEAARQAGVARLAVVFVSHNDLDHLAGIFEVISRFGAGQVRYNHGTVIPQDPDERKKLRAALRSFRDLTARGIDTRPVTMGEAGSVGAIKWRVLAPDHSQISFAQGIGDPNHSSVVMRLDIASSSFLIAGDAEGLSWRSLIDGQADLEADVFLIPHHGAAIAQGGRRASLIEILEAVNASTHVISVGTTNPYGHPDAETLRLLHESSARLLCTQANKICLATVEVQGVRKAAEAALPPSCLAGASGATPNAAPCAGTITFIVHQEGVPATQPDASAHEAVVAAMGDPHGG